MWKKDSGQICPEIHYQKTEQGIMVTGCYGMAGPVVLPDEINGIAVTGIAPYAFAEDGEEEEQTRVWISGQALSDGDHRRICGEMITEIWLPVHVTEIGRYAFYRCRNLKKLVLSDSLPEIGGGALTGCRLSEVEIYFYKGERSCLKSILDEMRFVIRTRLHYCAEGEETARLLFPEHYEEAVENTPARILFTQHHGAGGYYRQCFYDRKLDYKKYDELFFYTVAQEQSDIAVELILNRLRYPYRLSDQARNAYETYIKDHAEDTAEYLIDCEDTKGICFLAAGDFWTEQALEHAVDKASVMKKTELLSLLMDEKHRRYPKRRKTFEL